jgi:hypothetical protein
MPVRATGIYPVVSYDASRSTESFAVEVALSHIPHERLVQVAESTLAEKAGYVKAASVLTSEETAHIRACPDCIDSLAEIAREFVAKRQRRKASGGPSI